MDAKNTSGATETVELPGTDAPEIFDTTEIPEISDGIETLDEPENTDTPVKKPHFRHTLSFHLLMLFVAVSTAVILVLDVTFTAFSYRSTINDLDNDLTEYANSVVDKYVRTATDNTDKQRELFTVSDHYIHIHFTTNPLSSSSDSTTSDSTEQSNNADTSSTTPSSGTSTTPRRTAYLTSLHYSDDDDDDDDNDDDDDDDDNVASSGNTGTKKSTTNNTGNRNSGSTINKNTGNTVGGTNKGSTNKSGTNEGNTNVSENDTDYSVDPAAVKPPSYSIVMEGDYDVYTLKPDKDVIEKYGLPVDIEKLENTSTNKSQTIESTNGSDWRAVSAPILSSDGETVVGHVVIARPLAPALESVRNTALYLGLFGLIVAALGSVLAAYLISRSLRSLQQIEEATHAIAAGDLSQRVPSGVEGSEVGMLATSINTMLSHIEHSFEVKDQSEAKMRQFISDASHELRTPLATVRGYSELYRIGGVPEGEVDQAMDRIESEAKRMGVLVEDLLQLARLDERRLLNFEAVNVGSAAVLALNDFKVRDPQREVRLVDLDGNEIDDTQVESILIHADENKVEQVLANLLSNVHTHTPAGTPVELAIGTAMMPDAAGEGDVSEHVVIEVRDHGNGVPEEEREKIFERFFRTDSSRSRHSGGSGLGLSIVSSVMQTHGGYAEALETDGGGLTIRLVFPTEAAKPATPVAA